MKTTSTLKRYALKNVEVQKTDKQNYYDSLQEN